MINLSELMSAFEEGGLVVDWEKLDPEKTFPENGIDSLDVMSLFLAVEEQYKVKFPDSEVESMDTPAKLLNSLNSLLSGQMLPSKTFDQRI